VNIRRLRASDAPAFQALRLYGLKESPSAFGSSFEEEQTRTIQQVEHHLEGTQERVFFGSFADGGLLGMVGVGREQGLKERHIAFIRSMYVAPQARHQGAARGLLQVALNQAAAWSGVEQVTLSVTAANTGALALYRSVGFREVGHMPRALRIGTEYFDEVLMFRLLRDEDPSSPAG
jgi:RimJ/RimL family protein N-acetyltransferase